MKICLKCNHENKDTSKFCEECGTKLNGTPKFCPECGSKIGNISEVTPAMDENETDVIITPVLEAMIY